MLDLAERLVADAGTHAQLARDLARQVDQASASAAGDTIGSGVRGFAPRPGAAGPSAPPAAGATLAQGADQLTVGAQKLAQAAFALDLKIKFARSTNTFRAWQQIPAWLLALAGVGLAFYLASKEQDSPYAWVTVVLILVLAVVAMFRGPADISLGSGGGGGKPSTDAAGGSGTATDAEAEPEHA